MIEVKEYENCEKALERILVLDEDYIIIRHDFKEGEIIEAHSHPVNEWVIFDSGKCKVGLGLESKTLEAKNGAIVIYLPKNEEHGLKCLSDISYWVVRDTEKIMS